MTASMSEMVSSQHESTTLDQHKLSVASSLNGLGEDVNAQKQLTGTAKVRLKFNIKTNPLV